MISPSSCCSGSCGKGRVPTGYARHAGGHRFKSCSAQSHNLQRQNDLGLAFLFVVLSCSFSCHHSCPQYPSSPAPVPRWQHVHPLQVRLSTQKSHLLSGSYPERLDNDGSAADNEERREGGNRGEQVRMARVLSDIMAQVGWEDVRTIHTGDFTRKTGRVFRDVNAPVPTVATVQRRPIPIRPRRAARGYGPRAGRTTLGHRPRLETRFRPAPHQRPRRNGGLGYGIGGKRPRRQPAPADVEGVRREARVERQIVKKKLLVQ
jgi:hypothetical protein